MYLFKNGKLITNDLNDTFIENGAVAVLKDRIIDVGSEDELACKYADAKQIDAHGGVIMPGLINLFSTSQSIFYRGIKHINAISGSDRFCKIPSLLNLDGLMAAAYASALESLKNGVTTVLEHLSAPRCIHGSLQTVASAFRNIGIRSCLCVDVNENAPWKLQQKASEENLEFSDYCTSLRSAIIRPAMGLSVSDGANGDYLDRYPLLNRSRLSFHIIVNNSEFSSINSIRKYRLTPIERLSKAGLLSGSTIAAMRRLDKTEFETLLQSGAGILPIDDGISCELYNREAGECGIIPFCIGTGLRGFDVIESARTLNRRLQCNDSSSDNGSSVNALFSANSQIASRLMETDLGVIKPGAAADIVVMKYDCYTPMNAANAISHIASWCGSKQCETAMVAGKLLLEYGELKTWDETEIKLRAVKAAESLWRLI